MLNIAVLVSGGGTNLQALLDSEARGENYFGDVKIVDVNIRRLRMKVEDEPSHPTHILTVWGYGYRWEE